MENQKVKKTVTMNQLLDQSKMLVGKIEGISKAIDICGSLPIQSAIRFELASLQIKQKIELDQIFEDMKKHIEELLK